jgi:hypothetical protein
LSAALLASWSVETAAAASVLEKIASDLTPGNWAEVPTQGINEALSNTGGSSNTIFGYAEKIVWDAVSRRLFYYGHDHFIHPPRFVSYREDTNLWERLPEMPASFQPGFNHGYANQTVDPVGRHFYTRTHFSSSTIARYDIDRNRWDAVSPPVPANVAYMCCIGLEYFPEMKGVAWAHGAERVVQARDGGPNYTVGGLFLFQPQTNSWKNLDPAMAATLGRNNFLTYNPIHRILLMGGELVPTTTKGTLSKLDAQGRLSRLHDAPITFHSTVTVSTVDPVTGDYLFLHRDRKFLQYDVVAETWAELPIPDIELFGRGPFAPVFGTVAGPIGTHGVVAFVGCPDRSGTNCRFYVYKHRHRPSTERSAG